MKRPDSPVDPVLIEPEPIPGKGWNAGRLQCVVVAAVLTLAWTGQNGLAARGDVDRSAATFLAQTFNLSAADLRHLEAGEVLARSLDVSDDREVALLGIVRVAITPDFYAARVADVVNFKKADAVLEIGTFTESPSVESLRGLTLDRSERDHLQACRVGDCGVQLPAAAIRRFRAMNWGAAQSSEQAQSLMREVLAGVAAEYRAAGGRGLITYADGKRPTMLAHEFDGLVASDQKVLPRFPVVRRRLLQYPSVGAGDGVDVIYWSKEKLGPAKVISLTHLAIMQTGRTSPADYVITSNQIYASHYFDASLGLTVVVPGDSGPPATYIAYLNRSRLDAFDGWLGGIKRALVRRRARAAAERYLAQMRETLQRDFAAAR